MLIVVKQSGAGLRSFGSLLPRPDYSRVITGDGLSPIRMSRGSITPTMAAKLLRYQLSTDN
jgi:hypothetical protein